MFIRAETVFDNDWVPKFFISDAVDSTGSPFVLEDCAARDELFAFRGFVLAFSKEDAAVCVR